MTFLLLKDLLVPVMAQYCPLVSFLSPRFCIVDLRKVSCWNIIFYTIIILIVRNRPETAVVGHIARVSIW